MNICMIAGEASGDFSGALLAQELRRRMPDVVLWGIGGRRMREAGVELMEDGSRWSAIGIMDSLKLVPALLVSLFHVRHALKTRRPDLLIPIDFGAFNVRVAGYARQTLGIKVLYYFPPGSWRRDGKINPRIPLVADMVATPFSWSEEALVRAGVNARFVGHPLLDAVQPKCTPEEFREAFGLANNRPVIGLLPGSRHQEVRHILDAQLQAAKLIAQKMPQAGFVIPLALNVDRRQVEARISAQAPGLKTVVVQGQTYEAMDASDMLVVTSGTATLEATILGKPMVIVYRGSWQSNLEYRLRRKIIPMIGLPNIIAGKMLVPELVQMAATPENIAARALEFLENPEKCSETTAALKEITKCLGEPGAVQRVADMVIDFVSERRQAS